MQLPVQLLKSLEGTKGFDRQAFEQVHASGEQVTSIRINPIKDPNLPSYFIRSSKIPWTEFGYYLSERPSFTFDPLFHAGCYYVQEASSMFLEQALKQTCNLSNSLKILDLCAAPGGKSTHIQSLITQDSLLVSNDVIRSRANVLKDNIIKWGTANVVVTNNDPKDFSGLSNYFDVIVIDAPCSGSGLFRRDPEAIEEWSENNVQLCSQRQQRILADALPALKKDGILIYSTCSYSMEEDEDITKWLLNEFPLQQLPIVVDSDWGIVNTGSGYRFWPDKVKGEGLFLGCFQNRGGEEDSHLKNRTKFIQADKNEVAIIDRWVQQDDQLFIKINHTIYAWPQKLADEFSMLSQKLRIIYSGTLIGELLRDKLIPDHALAMSPKLLNEAGRVELDRELAIKYLQRKDINIPETERGWKFVTYDQFPLGWVNILHNRVNNYYPKELRILKEN